MTIRSRFASLAIVAATVTASALPKENPPGGVVRAV
jgi:hypothetical protein